MWLSQDVFSFADPILEVAMRRFNVGLVLSALCVGLLAPFAGAPTEALAQGPTGVLATEAAVTCGETIEAAPPLPRQVNLVLDDSGSMFLGGEGALQRWSHAKYSLEVFAAMLDKKDVLNVYRTSDFLDGNIAGPVTSVTGAEPTSQRIDKIHSMPMQGGGTPYATVTTASDALLAGTAPDKWLVVLSDGEFEGAGAENIQSYLDQLVANNQTETGGVRVAFLALGDEANELSADATGRLFFEKAANTDALLSKMTSFSNLIFARSQLPQSALGQMNTDIEMDEILAFAQGDDVRLGDLTIGGEKYGPSSEVGVSWVNNPPALAGSGEVEAVPDQGLQGKLATYQNIPAGSGAISATGASEIDLFYKPHAAFGIELLDAEGTKVETGKVVGGDYTVNYGFMNSNCEFIESDLLGDVSYTARLTQGDTVVAEAFAPGDKVPLTKGDAKFSVTAGYLRGNTTSAEIDLKVLRPAKPTAFEIEEETFAVSKLADEGSAAPSLDVHYAIHENGEVTDFSAEEWATFTPESFTVETDEDLEFVVALGDAPGKVTLTPRAPGDDVYAASTGEIPITLSASHVYDEQLNEATLETTVTVENDLSFWDRALNWFMSVGWKWLLALLALILVLGYVFQRRFPKKLQRMPLINYRPKQLGEKADPKSGRFRENRSSKFVPYGAHTGTIVYVPQGTAGFIPLKVKAMRGGRMQVVNWREVAARENVAFNGEKLTKQTKRAQNLRATSQITAVGPRGTYDARLDQSRAGSKRTKSKRKR